MELVAVGNGHSWYCDWCDTKNMPPANESERKGSLRCCVSQDVRGHWKRAPLRRGLRRNGNTSRYATSDRLELQCGQLFVLRLTLH